MPSLRRSPSPEVAALRAAVEGSCKQLGDQTRQQARLIHSGAVGELTEGDVDRMAKDITAAARPQLDAAAPHFQSPSADPELPSSCPHVAIAGSASKLGSPHEADRHRRPANSSPREWSSKPRSPGDRFSNTWREP
jgi:hypothetical protein